MRAGTRALLGLVFRLAEREHLLQLLLLLLAAGRFVALRDNRQHTSLARLYRDCIATYLALSIVVAHVGPARVGTDDLGLRGSDRHDRGHRGGQRCKQRLSAISTHTHTRAER